ncbi:MAG: Lar family restriction alleviation protein [Candidatus Ornithomonoglobus sp.]
MNDIQLKPCPFCGRKAAIEMWSSAGPMYMVKCNNPDCPIPIEGYPSGHDLVEVKLEWNRRAE